MSYEKNSKECLKGRQGLKGSNNAVFTPTSTDHYSRCGTATGRHENKGKKQATIVDMFQGATKRKGQGTKNAKRQKQSVEVDSDIDSSDCELDRK